jgi:hypothetical protein
MLGIGTPNGPGRGPKVASVGADGMSASGFLPRGDPTEHPRDSPPRPGAIRVDIASGGPSNATVIRPSPYMPLTIVGQMTDSWTPDFPI